MILSSMTMMLKDNAVMTTKSINLNGVYDATSEGYSGYEIVNVNVDEYEKYNKLYKWNGLSGPGNNQSLIEPISTTDYDEFWMVGHNAYSSYNALWNTRFLTSIIFDSP